VFTEVIDMTSKLNRTRWFKTRPGISMAVAACLAAGAAQGARPPGGEVTVNNLSFPAVLMHAEGAQASFSATNEVFGSTYSYACNKPETIDGRTFPNTSCVTSDGSVYYTAEQCTAPGAPCDGLPVDRMYWQKRPLANRWAPDTVSGENGPEVEATHLDWGDNLESVSWTDRSVIRVEMTPFAQLQDPLRGLQMWHVYGQGITELWGARATEEGLPYVYETPSAIINTIDARLNIAKLANGPATCPTEGPGEPPVPGNWVGGKWEGTWLLRDEAFTPELNIGGRYVYGYNWKMRRDVVPQDVDKQGWWRLTFYAPDRVRFTGATMIEPPVVGDGTPTPLPAVTIGIESEEEEGPLYRPVVDAANNLTYIDICIVSRRGGGGKP
jgi:hypothetical protein